MALSMEELATMDFSDVATGERLNAVAPGDILMHEFMEPMSISANALAKAMKVPANRITAILKGTRILPPIQPCAYRLPLAFQPTSGWGFKASTISNKPKPNSPTPLPLKSNAWRLENAAY